MVVVEGVNFLLYFFDILDVTFANGTPNEPSNSKTERVGDWLRSHPLPSKKQGLNLNAKNKNENKNEDDGNATTTQKLVDYSSISSAESSSPATKKTTQTSQQNSWGTISRRHQKTLSLTGKTGGGEVSSMAIQGHGRNGRRRFGPVLDSIDDLRLRLVKCGGLEVRKDE
jgi:hypothetical protein